MTLARARVANDFYPTPALLTRHLLKAVPIRGTILEPCAGDGAMAQELNSEPSWIAWQDDIAQSDYRRTHDATDEDFWKYWSKELLLDWVVTNPPYNAASTILPLAFTHARKGVAMLLRLSYLEPCRDRANWLTQHSQQLSHLIVFSPRPRFRSDSRGSDSVTNAWFVWQKDWNAGTQHLYVADWR